MSFYKTRLLQSKTDKDYGGITVYKHILDKCTVGEVVDLGSEAQGKLIFWLNDYCYTGWGARGKEIVKAFILVARLPRSFIDHDVGCTWCVVNMERGVEVLNKLIPPTDEDELMLYKLHTYNFISQHSLSNKFYENVMRAAGSTVYQRRKTYFNRDIRGWRDIVTAYDELMMLTAYAKRMAAVGGVTYGCKLRSNTWSPTMNKAYAQAKIQMTYSSFQKTEGLGIAAYLMRELDKRDAVTAREDTYALMEYISTHVNFLLSAAPTVPTELTEETLDQFRKCSVDLNDFSALDF